VDLVLFALSLAGLAGVSAWLCRWRRRAGAAVLAGGAALVLAAGSISYLAHDGRMETNHMAKQTKSSAQAKAKPRAAGASPLFTPPSEPLAQRAWLAVAEEIGPPPAPGMLPVPASVCEGVRTPPRWEGK
jgi:hypothetical protein